MKATEKLIPLSDLLARGGRRYELQQDHQRVIDACRREVATTCSGWLARWLDTLDNILFELANKTAGASGEPDYFSDMRELRRGRAGVEADYLGEVLQGYDRFWQLGPGLHHAAAAPDREMKLLEADELEESLAVSEIVSAAQKRYHSELVALDRRFSFMLQGAAVTRETNPLAPAALSRAGQHALASLMLGLPVRLMAYKLFDREVMQHAVSLYDELNARLDHADILPGLIAKRGNRPAAPDLRSATLGQSADAGSPDSRAPTQDQPDSGIGVYGTLRSLLQAGRSRHRHEVGKGAPEQVQWVATADLLRALDELQRSSLALGLCRAEPAVLAGRGLMDELRQALRLGQTGEVRRSLREADQDTVELIAMLFDFILHDRSLPQAMKALLARLQPPILKVALLDRSFFPNKSHPARQLLNQLSQMALAWTDDGDRSAASLYGRVESIVNRVAVEFAADPEVFKVISGDLRDYLRREQQSARMTEERTRQMSRGKEQLRTARRRANQEIASRLGQYDKVPEVVCRLLMDAWKDVLLLAYLRQGPDSPQWKGALAVVDRLLWSVQPRPQPGQRQELLQTIPGLLVDLRSGLTGIAYDPARMGKLFKDLQALHVVCLRGRPGDAPMRLAVGEDKWQIRKSDIAALEDAANAHGAVAPEAGGEFAEQRPEEPFLRLAADLPVGSWLDLMEAEGRRSRVKLSWKSDDKDVLVFVNRKGMKAAEMTSEALAGLLSRAAAQVLDVPNEPLTDRALATILQRLDVAKPSSVGRP